MCVCLYVYIIYNYVYIYIYIVNKWILVLDIVDWWYLSAGDCRTLAKHSEHHAIVFLSAGA